MCSTTFEGLEGHVLVEEVNFHLLCYFDAILVPGASVEWELFFKITSMMCAKVCCTDIACKYNPTFELE
jgi:hypothetical protein